MEMRTLEHLSGEYCCYILAINLRTFCLCPDPLCEVEFKGDELIHEVEKISRQHSIKAMWWVLLDATSQITVSIRSKNESMKIQTPCSLGT
jgi:hypothetical protein